jgi:hypothetical protein
MDGDGRRSENASRRLAANAGDASSTCPGLPAVTGEGRLVRGLIGDGGLTVAAGGTGRKTDGRNSGSVKNKAQAAAGRILPETAKAKVQAQQTEPGSGERD